MSPLGRFGALAMACQVFAGHLQDTILTCSLLGVYGLLRASGERTWSGRRFILLTTVVMVALGGLLAWRHGPSHRD
jgi:hypothetical protein